MDFRDKTAIIVETNEYIQMVIEGGGFKTYRITLKKEPISTLDERRENALLAINELEFKNKEEVLDRFMYYGIL